MQRFPDAGDTSGVGAVESRGAENTVRKRAGSVEAQVVSTPLSNPDKRALKSRAQHLEPMVKVGHAGVSEGFLRSLDAALLQHELVKIKFTDFKEQKHELVPQIAEKTNSTLIAQVGNVAVYYRQKPKGSAADQPDRD